MFVARLIGLLFVCQVLVASVRSEIVHENNNIANGGESSMYDQESDEYHALSSREDEDYNIQEKVLLNNLIKAYLKSIKDTPMSDVKLNNLINNAWRLDYLAKNYNKNSNNKGPMPKRNQNQVERKRLSKTLKDFITMRY